MACDFFKLANPGVMRLAPYKAGKPVEELRRELHIEDIIKLASNENPLGASPKAIAAAQGTLARSSRYPDSHSYYLKKALAEFHQVDTDNITIGNGSDQILSLIAQAFIHPGHEVIFSEYAFATFAILTQAHHGVPVVVAAKEWGNDLTAISAAITPKTRIIFMANPNNPTATLFCESMLHQFMQHVPEDVLVVIDEAYYEYALHPAYPNTIQLQKKYPNIITTRSFSKAYGLAGLRVGYCVAHPDCNNCLQRIRLPFSVSRPAEAAAVAALHDNEHITRTVCDNQTGHEQLQHAFHHLGLSSLPSITNFITVDMGPDAQAIYEALLKHGIIVRPLVPYAMPNHLRITVGTEAQNQRLIKALEIILAKEPTSHE